MTTPTQELILRREEERRQEYLRQLIARFAAVEEIADKLEAENARLRASNTELLAACKDLLESTWEILIPGHPSLAHTQCKAQRAIANAERS